MSLSPDEELALNAALQADVADALRHLGDESRAPEESWRGRMVSRFGSAERTPVGRFDDVLVGSLVEAFQDYWWNSLLKPAARENHEDRLVVKLQQLSESTEDVFLEELEARLSQSLSDLGCHALFGRTAPLRELMLWRDQQTENRAVVLPEGTVDCRVEILDDFVSMGWTDYATCGLRGAGGWATPTSLFVVAPRYSSLDDEWFSVHFVAHEAQHLLDLRRFPAIEAWELEYRAKLAELSLATCIQPSILSRFLEDQSDDSRSPHGFANREIAAVFSEFDLKTIVRGQKYSSELKDEARRMLIADSHAGQLARPDPS